jgi:hypothetical protein
MASTKKDGDRARRRKSTTRSERAGPDPASRAADDRGTTPYQEQNRGPQGPRAGASDKDVPDDGGAESDRGTVVKQDRNFDAGPAPNARK